ncbi:PREDICTED: glycerol-3-phosphate acyltransferase 3-like [Amphimedon queenslandica]|uniref:Phospholipid/glycerol acyltransferase domain-containing protein n=1 Tax=Amphimedon queenslandica TaxID=400682 RepID=A0A1X7VKQ5_AMPQE|nr:PREDICTED: glycerol-3-phosphate acyltransferase 3-like [Amphimedon queenslandica]|eukprot:XP_019864353.1 PREDICTED: glycerol-3-phosphate acyltransferase 3-like [Amphimedon queenslandica]
MLPPPDPSSLLNDIEEYAFLILRFMFSFWSLLISYNMISAFTNLCLFRRIYIGLLRRMYRLFGFKAKRSVVKNKTVRFQDDIIDNGGVGSTLTRRRSNKSFKGEFQIGDIVDYVHDGIEVIIEDEVTKCFSTEDVEEWNLMSRTRFKENLGLKMELLLILSVIFRFTIFLLIRLPIGIASLLWLIITMVVLSIIRFLFPHSRTVKQIERYCVMVCSRLIAAAFSAVVNIQHAENRAKLGSVCVANHTTPVDIIMLAVDNCFTLVGQRHGGIMGVVQVACSLAQEHIWFERKIASDRRMVASRLKEFLSNPMNNPILIFPEGTCINNTSVFMFKKGCFELGATIFPVVIKYHREFADPYWNSQEQSMVTYLAMLMTSWAIVCDIDYLNPTTLKEGETAIEFANRVKADICRRGGLVDLPWDGMIKRPAGTESYLNKLIEEERRTYLEELLDKEDNESDDDEGGLVMRANRDRERQ